MLQPLPKPALGDNDLGCTTLNPNRLGHLVGLLSVPRCTNRNAATSPGELLYDNGPITARSTRYKYALAFKSDIQPSVILSNGTLGHKTWAEPLNMQ